MLPIEWHAVDDIYLIRYLSDPDTIRKCSDFITALVGPSLRIASTYFHEYGYIILKFPVLLTLGLLLGLWISETSKNGNISVSHWLKGQKQKIYLVPPYVPATSRKKVPAKDELAIKDLRIKNLQSHLEIEMQYHARISGEAANLKAQLREQNDLAEGRKQEVMARERELRALQDVYKEMTQILTEHKRVLEEQLKLSKAEAETLLKERDVALENAEKAEYELENLYHSREFRGMKYVPLREIRRQKTYIAALERKVQNLEEVLAEERAQKQRAASEEKIKRNIQKLQSYWLATQMKELIKYLKLNMVWEDEIEVNSALLDNFLKDRLAGYDEDDAIRIRLEVGQFTTKVFVVLRELVAKAMQAGAKKPQHPDSNDDKIKRKILELQSFWMAGSMNNLISVLNLNMDWDEDVVIDPEMVGEISGDSLEGYVEHEAAQIRYRVGQFITKVTTVLNMFMIQREHEVREALLKGYGSKEKKTSGEIPNDGPGKWNRKIVPGTPTFVTVVSPKPYYDQGTEPAGEKKPSNELMK